MQLPHSDHVGEKTYPTQSMSPFDAYFCFSLAFLMRLCEAHAHNEGAVYIYIYVYMCVWQKYIIDSQLIFTVIKRYGFESMLLFYF